RDWSSDVCSSDLAIGPADLCHASGRRQLLLGTGRRHNRAQRPQLSYAHLGRHVGDPGRGKPDPDRADRAPGHSRHGARFCQKSRQEGRMILDVQGVETSYGAMKVLHGVDLQVKEGETFAIIGPNGAGKSTLFKVLTGERIASAGTIHYRGEDVTKLSAFKRARKGMGRTFQVARIFPELDLETNVIVA